MFMTCKNREIWTSPTTVEAVGLRWTMQTSIKLKIQHDTFVSNALVVVKRVEGRPCPAEINLIVHDCISLCIDFVQVYVVFVKTALNIETHKLIQLAKFVGTKIWIGYIPNDPINYIAHVGVLFYRYKKECFD